MSQFWPFPRTRSLGVVERNSFRSSVPLVSFERANRSAGAGKKRNEFRSTKKAHQLPSARQNRLRALLPSHLANLPFGPSRCLHGASWVGKLHSVQVNADRRDHDTWLTWLSPRVRLTDSAGAGKPRARRSVPTIRCS